MDDVNLKFERNLRFYEDLEEDFNNMMQLAVETEKLVRMHSDIKWGKSLREKMDETADTPSKKRKRGSSLSSQDGDSSSGFIGWRVWLNLLT